jgi:hypothetical protein
MQPEYEQIVNDDQLYIFLPAAYDKACCSSAGKRSVQAENGCDLRPTLTYIALLY